MVPSPVPVLLLAQVQTTDFTNPTVAMIVVIAGLGGLLFFANQVGDLIARFRRTPPIEQELGSFATKDDLAAVDRRLSDEISSMRTHVSASHGRIYERIEAEAKETQDKIDELGKTINTEFRTLYRALGKTEGKLEEVAD